MVAEDVLHVSAIEQQVTPHPWRESQFIESVSKHCCLVLTLETKVIGYTIYTIVAGEAEILNIAIHPDYQGKGYGRQLLDHLMVIVCEQAERLYLEVRASNASAIHLYQEVGFAEICLRHNYYPTPSGTENAIVMAIDFQFGL
ncbi:MAG: ribosomal-protein-alanine N-acetyltransferase [Porticoccus sp.]|jgi:ribosomal-protein-alanine N-acetyltransferase